MLYWLLEQSREWLIDKNLYTFVRVLDQVQFRALAAGVLAFAFVVLFGKRTIDWLRRKKIGDSGVTDAAALAAQASQKANTPSMGGILIVGAILLATLLLADLTEFYIRMGLIVTVWMAAVGGADDWLKLTAKQRGSGRQGLYSWEKLVFQLGIGLIVGYYAYDMGNAPGSVIHALNLPFQRTYLPDTKAINPSLYVLGAGSFVVLATMMVAGMSNAVNITDGMDGLATGGSSAVAIGLFVLALVAGDQGLAQYLLVPHVPGAGELTVLAAATAGACLGFLWWNCWPAQVFMGDCGALALGGLIGYIAVIVRQEAVVLLMCGVFIAELASVMIQVASFRLRGGKKVFLCAPYHHHLHLAGWPEQRVVARLWIIGILLVVISLATLKLR
jgi:phospho-N-acetylmuramoyl-pentapeptide-transferase